MATKKTAARRSTKIDSHVDGDTLVLVVPLNPKLPVSKSGKSHLAHNSGGFRPLGDLTYKGKPLRASVNVIVPLD